MEWEILVCLISCWGFVFFLNLGYFPFLDGIFPYGWKHLGSQGSSIVVEDIRAVLFFYQDVLHKNKTPKYLNTPKTHNQAHSLGKKCPDKIDDKKNNQLFVLRTRYNDKIISLKNFYLDNTLKSKFYWPIIRLKKIVDI